MEKFFLKKYTTLKRKHTINKLKKNNYKFLYGEQNNARKLVIIFIIVYIIFYIICCLILPIYLDITTSLFTNSYFIGITSSIIGIIILYIFNNYYCKYMIKTDVRCKEIMDDLALMSYFLIDDFYEKRNLFNEDAGIDLSGDFISEFMNHTFISIKFNATSLASDNNLILIQSLETSFLTNINFKLLNIINNIKNRYPNIKKDINNINNYFNVWNKHQNSSSLDDLVDELRHFKVDVFFLIKYWLTLLDYLKYDYINKWENYDFAKFTKEEHIERYKYLFELPNFKKIYDVIMECKEILQDDD